MEERTDKIILTLIIIIITISSLLIISFFYTRKCSDYNCFNSAVINCERVRYLDESVEATWEYNVLGNEKRCVTTNGIGKCTKYETYCKINVKLLMVKKGKTEAESLVDKEMICKISKVDAISLIDRNQDIKPQSDISKCNGILKEDMQEIMIKNLWGIIIKNLGDIKEEVKPL